MKHHLQFVVLLEIVCLWIHLKLIIWKIKILKLYHFVCFYPYIKCSLSQYTYSWDKNSLHNIFLFLFIVCSFTSFLAMIITSSYSLFNMILLFIMMIHLALYHISTCLIWIISSKLTVHSWNHQAAVVVLLSGSPVSLPVVPEASDGNLLQQISYQTSCQSNPNYQGTIRAWNKIIRLNLCEQIFWKHFDLLVALHSKF